jgi:hypothetical protein
MNRLNEDVLRLIWRKVYNYVIEEIKNFIEPITLINRNHRIYIYKKPNCLNEDDVYLTIRERWGYYQRNGEYVFESCDTYVYGNRIRHVLHFYQAILFLKHHPTGRYREDESLTIRHEEYSDDEE